MTLETVGETWSWRELPILRAALRRIDAGDPIVDLEGLRAEVGLDVVQMRTALKALHDAGYVEVAFRMGGPNRLAGHLDAVYEVARRELGSWPSASAILEQIVDALRNEASSASDDERKERLNNAADLLGRQEREVALAAIASKIGHL